MRKTCFCWLLVIVFSKNRQRVCLRIWQTWAMNAIYPACCRPFWENSRFHPFHHLSFEGWKSFDWRATSMRRNWPSQTSIWSHRRSPLGGLFFRTAFFRIDIFAGWQGVKWFSERGWWVCLVPRTNRFWYTHDHTCTVYMLFSIYIYYIILHIHKVSTFYPVVFIALVVSDLLQDGKKTSWYVIICGLLFRQTTAWQRTCWIFNPRWYCWWTKSCTTKDVDYPIIYRVFTIPGGAGFCPTNSMSSWMSWVMFLESRCVVAKKAHH